MRTGTAQHDHLSVTRIARMLGRPSKVVDMAILNLSELKPGMVLAEPVITKKGSVLLGEGNVLTERHLAVFKQWGITQADIAGADREEIAQFELKDLSEDDLKAIDLRLQARFVSLDQNEVTAEIYRIARKKAAKNLLEQYREKDFHETGAEENHSEGG